MRGVVRNASSALANYFDHIKLVRNTRAECVPARNNAEEFYWSATTEAVVRVQRRASVRVRLTALDGVGGGLQGHRPPVGLVDVHSKHQPHASVFTSDVRFSFAKLNVRVA